MLVSHADRARSNDATPTTDRVTACCGVLRRQSAWLLRVQGNLVPSTYMSRRRALATAGPVVLGKTIAVHTFTSYDTIRNWRNRAFILLRCCS